MSLLQFARKIRRVKVNEISLEMMVYGKKKKKKEDVVTRFSYLHLLSSPVYSSNVSSLNCLTRISSILAFRIIFFYTQWKIIYLFLGKFSTREW